MAAPHVYQREVQPRLPMFTAWERVRHGKAHWLIECIAETLGTFLYTYAGVGSTASFVVGHILELEGLSSVLQIGFSYALGIVFAITLCAPTSGGHFSPCVTIAMIIFKGFPPVKGLRYIVAQILGGYLACLVVYVSYYDLLHAAEGVLRASGTFETVMYTPQGPAGVLALYAPPGVHIGRIFFNEFITDTMLAIVIWGCLDPSNLFVPPPMLPFVIAFAYAVAIWSYATPGIAANAARDVGGRLAAITVYGLDASGGAYAAIAALANIPAMLFGVMIYELFLADPDRVVPASWLDAIRVLGNHKRTAPVESAAHDRNSTSTDSGDKPAIHQTEHIV